MGKLSKLFLTLAIVFTVAFGAWATTRIVKSYKFDNNCEVYIERAANASSVEMAKEELGKAIKYAEDNNLTEGIVSIFLKQPKNDVGYWYKNMKTAYEELENLPEDATTLEKSNVLMKLRESLVDSSDGSTTVRHPDGISIYPNNVAYFWWGMISGFGALGLFIAFFIRFLTEDYY